MCEKWDLPCNYNIRPSLLILFLLRMLEVSFSALLHQRSGCFVGVHVFINVYPFWPRIFVGKLRGWKPCFEVRLKWERRGVGVKGTVGL